VQFQESVGKCIGHETSPVKTHTDDETERDVISGNSIDANGVTRMLIERLKTYRDSGISRSQFRSRQMCRKHVDVPLNKNEMKEC